MPFLDLLDDQGNLAHDSAFGVIAVMTHPEDEQARHQLLARIHERVAASVERKLAETDSEPDEQELRRLVLGVYFSDWLEPYGGFQTLAAAPSGDEAIEHFYEAMWPGAVPAEMLDFMFKMQTSGVRPSVNKAVYLTHCYLRHVTEGMDEKGGGSSERYIRQSWSRLRSVAHLWFAFRTWQFEGQVYERLPTPDPDSPISPVSPETLPGFLALAEWALARAAEIKPHRGQSVLDSAQAWRVPEALNLPTMNVNLAPLEPHKAAWLRDYRSPGSR